MSFRVYLYAIRLLTPTVLTSTYGFRGMSYTVVSDYIPGSVVRGALLSELMIEGLLDKRDADLEAVNPLHVFSPALHVPRDRAEAVPLKDVAFAHALAYQLKGDNTVYSFGIEKLIERVEKGVAVEEALTDIIGSTLESIDRDAYRTTTSSGFPVRSSAEMKPASHSVIVRTDGSWRITKPGRGIYVENAVERSRGSAAHGMLYAYEYLKPGERFVGFIILSEHSYLVKPLEDLARGKCINVRIGRGLGRGFGLAELYIREADYKLLSSSEESACEGLVAFYTFAPFAELDPLPRPPRAGEELEIEVFGNIVGKAKVVAALGRGSVEYRGWSYRTSLPKLPVRALSPGSLIIAQLLDAKCDVLRLGAPVGLGPLSAQGFNIVVPLRRDFIPTAGGR